MRLVVIVFAAAWPAWAFAEAGALEPTVVAHIADVRAQHPERRDDKFAKMGGSSVASKAFLTCLATPHVDLGDWEALADTIDFFDTGRRNSFNRQSEAAGVSWNLRYALGGRPAHFREEIAETNARWALVLFGGNDAQNRNERIYAKRLVYLVEELEKIGVVPILGSATPRRNRTKDRWIRRFNAITEAVAEHWRLPHIDYYGAMVDLPRKGLARDGVHPNVLGQGGPKRACDFSERGLRYGNNVRNLLTLQMLDALRRSLGAGPAERAETFVSGVDDPGGAPVVTGAGVGGGIGEASATIGLTVTSGPAPHLRSARLLKSRFEEIEVPAGCGRTETSGRGFRLPVEVSEPMRLRVTALDLDGAQPRLHWIRLDDEGPRCVRRRSQTLEVAAAPGLWDLIVVVPERAAEEGEMLLLVDRNPMP